MAYQFPSDIDDRVKSRVNAGGYQNEDDVLRDAMDALDEREEAKSKRWDERNRIAIEQSRRGLSRPLDLDAVIERVEARVARYNS